MTTTPKPVLRPDNPRFSSGPCTKNPDWSFDRLAGAALGRSHRASPAKEKLREAIDRTREVLEVPDGWHIGIVPASDTGAVEMAMWSLLGPRGVEVLAWEAFGAEWVTDAVRELRLDPIVQHTDYGILPDLSAVDFAHDVIFTWNGTAAGVRVPDGNWIAADREGLTICDATSAAFAMDLPWDKLDVTTFSWQKVMGGEAAHGMIVLSPRAVERLESHKPAWPVPKIFRLVKNGSLDAGIFEGSTINTPSMMCVEDYLVALDWAERVGGLPALIARSRGNAKVVHDFVAARDWLDHLAVDPATRSTTSVCLRIIDPRIRDGAAFAKGMVARLADEGVAFDVGNYRDAPPGLRIWCGSTVEQADLEALLPWLDWAFEAELAAQAA